MSSQPSDPDTLRDLAPYLRVSSAEQRSNRTIDTQRGLLETWLAAQHVAPVGWYSDDGVSGALPLDKRPDGRRLLADVLAGRVRTVVVSKLDRLGRNAREILNTVHLLETSGARLVSIKEAVDTRTANGRFFLTVLSGVAELERDMILARAAEGMADRLLETSYMGGPAPYGYRVQGKRADARLVLADAEVPVVQRAWRLLVEQDMTVDAITMALHADGVPTRSASGQWHNSMVYRILSDPVYTGVKTYRTADGVVHRHAVPAILTTAQYEQAVATLAAHRRYSRQRACGTPPYLLRGLMRCAACGALYTTTRSRLSDGRAPRRYYACVTKHFRRRYAQFHLGIPGGCIGASVDAETAEQEVWQMVAYWLDHPGETLAEIAAEQQQSASQRAATHKALDDAQAAVDALQGERDRMALAYRKGILSETDLAHQLAGIADEERAARAKRDDAVATLRRAVDLDARLSGTRTLLGTLRERVLREPLTDALRAEIVSILLPQRDGYGIRVVTEQTGVSTRGRPTYVARLDVRAAFGRPVLPPSGTLVRDGVRQDARTIHASTEMP
jgi:site-specific DNA recombinase